jgi:hypothetical protein
MPSSAGGGGDFSRVWRSAKVVAKCWNDLVHYIKSIEGGTRLFHAGRIQTGCMGDCLGRLHQKERNGRRFAPRLNDPPNQGEVVLQAADENRAND